MVHLDLKSTKVGKSSHSGLLLEPLDATYLQTSIVYDGCIIIRFLYSSFHPHTFVTRFFLVDHSCNSFERIITQTRTANDSWAVVALMTAWTSLGADSVKGVFSYGRLPRFPYCVTLLRRRQLAGLGRWDYVSRNGSTVAFRLSHYSGQIKSKAGDGTSEQKTPQSSTETPKKCSAGLPITRDVDVGALLSLPWACSTSASSGRQGHRLRLR